MATRGTPLFGDRAAVDTINYASLHALDIRNLEFVVHVPQPTAQLNVPIADGDLHWEQRALTEADISDLSHTDASAIHDDVASEIHAITIKSEPIAEDEILLEDSENSWAKRRATLSSLPKGASSLDDLDDVNAPAPNDGDVLTWDDVAGEWVADAPPAGGAVDAADVTYTPAVNADWDGDADPGDVNNALDQLAERVDDLEGAGGGGDSTYTAAYGSRPAASNDGNLFLPSNGFVIERDTGAAWVPWGPIFPLAGVANAPDTWVNQGSATVTTTNGGIYLYDPANEGVSYRIRKKAAPSTPYTITALLLVNHGCWAHPSVGIGWRQSSDGKLVLARVLGMGYVHNLALLKANNETTDIANYVDQALGAVPWIWLRITDDGTNRIVSFSRDGQNFIQMHSVGRTDFLTADEVCLFASSRNSSFGAGVTLLSWKET